MAMSTTRLSTSKGLTRRVEMLELALIAVLIFAGLTIMFYRSPFFMF